MIHSNVAAIRGTVGSLKKYRSDDDSAIAAAYVALAEEKFVAAVERALAAAPPIRPEVRDRVIALLSTTAATTAA